MKVNRVLMPGPLTNGYTQVANGGRCFDVSEDSIPQTSRPSGTPLDRMTKIDLDSEPITPYHGKMSTENAKAWHGALVATAGEVHKRYGELKAFGASPDFHLEDLSQSLNGEVDVIMHARTNKLRFAGGAAGLGVALGATAAYLGHPIIGGILGLAGMITGGIQVSDAYSLKQSAESTKIAATLIEDWTKIQPAGAFSATQPPAADPNP